MDSLVCEDICVAVSKTNSKARLTRFGKPIKDIRRISLLAWKASGTSNDPDVNAATFQNEVLYLDLNPQETSSPPKGHDINNANVHLSNNIHCLNVPSQFVLGFAGDLWQELPTPRILSEYPKGDGVVEYFNAELRRNVATIPDVTLDSYTYVSLFLWVRFYFENSKESKSGCHCK